MRFLALVTIILTMWTASALYATRAAQDKAGAKAQDKAGATASSGVYTEGQAKLGMAAYAKHCSECHGEDFAGDGTAPALKGADFLANWSGLTVGELFDRIRESMPPENPDVVTPKQKIDIVAYLLKTNGYPAGTTELPATVEALKGIKLDTPKAAKPGAR